MRTLACVIIITYYMFIIMVAAVCLPHAVSSCLLVPACKVKKLLVYSYIIMQYILQSYPGIKLEQRFLSGPNSLLTYVCNYSYLRTKAVIC